MSESPIKNQSLTKKSSTLKSPTFKKLNLTMTSANADQTIVKGELLTPTSISMKNTFIVKNSDESFI